jgi:hypothetical protein
MKYLFALSLTACQNELPIFPGSGSELIVVCGDGNRIGSDGCTNDCLAARCGGGIRRRSGESEADLEACDDGNGVDSDGCRNNYQIARCGDGVQRFELGSGERSSCNEHDDCEGGRCVSLRCYAAGFEGCEEITVDETIETFSERGNAAAWRISAYSPGNGCPDDMRVRMNRLAIR